LYTDTIGKDRVGPRGADEAERARAGHGAAHAGGVVVDAVAAQVGGRVIFSADNGAMEIVVLDLATERHLDVKGRAGSGDVVAADVAAGRRGERNAGAAAAEGVLTHLDVGGPCDGNAATAAAYNV